MATQTRFSRRAFLKRASAGLGLTLAAPAVLPSSVLAANERVLIGHVGMRNRGAGLLRSFMKDTAAVCDVDSKILEGARQQVLRKGLRCDAYKDYRKILERKDIDAISIATPDHWHALITVDACRAGKDVYCEKPLTLTIAEGRAMVHEARKHERIVQTGSQQRSDGRFRLACELVRSGRIGKLRRITVGIPGVNFKGPGVPDSDPPEHLDYDFWLGPAPRRPYNEKRVHYNFRFFWDYSGGQITNWGAHHLDIAQWGMGADHTGPIEIEGTARYHEKRWYEVPEYFSVTFRYASGVTVLCAMGLRGGTTFEGTEGKIYVNRGKLESEPGDIIEKPLTEKDIHLYTSHNHQQNWIECVKSRKTPICDVEIGHRSATVCHLGNIAIRAGRKIRWDPVRERVVGDEEANARVRKVYRKPWTLL